MPLFTCDEAGCTGAAVRGKACLLCLRHLCTDHLKRGVHGCPNWQNDAEAEAWGVANARATRDEVNALIATVDARALENHATLLRGGIACTVVPLAYDAENIHHVMGGMNFHITICFADGVEWICRIRRNNVSSPPRSIQNAILNSEVATLKFLASIRVPVPQVHGYATFGDNNPVGVGYILMDKLPGRPLDLDAANAEQKRRFMSRFAEIFATLAAHPFLAIGSPLLSTLNQAVVGPVASETFAPALGSQILLGPFDSATEYRRTALEIAIELIRRQELYVDTSIDAYLVHRFLLDKLPLLDAADTSGGSGFYLKHMDDKGDHIMVDDDFNITGIIDWERAQTVPKAEAFAAPLFMLDVAEYYSGVNELSATESTFVEVLKEQGHAELAELVSRGRVQHRIMHCINGDVDDPDFPNIFMALLRLLPEQDAPTDSWDFWRAWTLRRFEDDPGLQALFA
ncbi:hypothetical protein PsYK624_025620 [Phanerochaete sordida]|uniref:Aminoglycoside phosphotransferase domain-containing protein n=1 Tax=Phanerochaete sordida TaxID=48140 RepID=A0A9P3G039_9APHY|nr:hypothetical protein PsYK624_025620 [Phanerochaete sordida]